MFLLMLTLQQQQSVFEAAAVSCPAGLSHYDQHTHVHISSLSNEADVAVADAACNVPQVASLNKAAPAEGRP